MNYLYIRTHWKTNKIIEAKPYPFAEDNLNVSKYIILEDNFDDEVGYIVNISGYIYYVNNNNISFLPKDVHNCIMGYKRKYKLKIIKNKINGSVISR
jgi:hypothetical protein